MRKPIANPRGLFRRFLRPEIVLLAAAFGWAGPCLATASASAVPTPEYPRMGPDIFDRTVDAEILISAALREAQGGAKRIVLLLGANWCPYCRRLHSVIQSDPALARELAEHFVFAYVDANWRTNRTRNATTLERLGNPIRKYGLPVIVVLNVEGKVLSIQETQPLAAPTDRELSERFLALLRKWRG